MDERPPDNLRDLGQIAIQAAISVGAVFRGPNSVLRPGRSLILKDLMLQFEMVKDAEISMNQFTNKQDGNCECEKQK